MNNAIILAAGKGSRMKTDIPKCIIPILNKPMVEYIIDAVNKTSLDNIICVVGHKKELLEKTIGNKVVYAYQAEQLGTAHAVMNAKDFVKGDGYSLIIPGDCPLIDEDILNDIINEHKNNKNDLTIATTKVDNPSGFGRIIRNATGRICKIIEENDASLEEKYIKEINTGIFCIDNNILFDALKRINNENSKKEYYITDIVEILSLKYKIGSYSVLDSYKVMGVNDLYSLSKLENILRTQINKKHMLNGVILCNPDSISISIDAKIGNGTIIEQNCKIFGNTTIGSNCIIGCNSDICDSIIENNVVVRSSFIHNSLIKKGANVGPYAHLRMNTVVGEFDRIGNFVEIKNSKIGKNSNAAHLTYIGDTNCGDEVNFGCGVVTVNYDGNVKHKTMIGNRVFIGCNSNLIAPINIGSDIYIAAGSTINQDLIDEDFAIARVHQIVKHNYSSKYGYKKSKL